MSNLVDYAENELKIIGMGKDTEDDYNKMMHDSIIEVVKKFSSQGHSGFSAPYAIGILEKVLMFEPLTPLTGDDSEWIEIDAETMGRPGVFQNKRCGRVFKEGDRAYDTEGKIFYTKDDQSDTYTSGDSRVTVTFPYVPTHEYVQVKQEVSDGQEGK